MSSTASADGPDPLFALVDCNNFYVSCERAFAPELNGRPVIVLSNNDGCIVARSNEAKALGLPMGAPYFKCRDLCRLHRVRIFSSNYPLYGDMSCRVVEVLRRFTPEIEVYSIDESFLGFTGTRAAHLIEEGADIRRTVEQWTGIPVSVGMAPTKTLAKLANRLAKNHPDAEGVFDLNGPDSRERILSQVAVDEIWGIGRRYKDKLARYGIHTAHQLTLARDAWIRKQLTVTGLRLVWELRGISCIPLDQAPAPRKAIARSRGFGQPLTTLDELREPVAAHVASAAHVLRRQRSVAGCLQVHLETSRFTGPYYGNAATIRPVAPTASTPHLIRLAHQGLERIFKTDHTYRRAGILLTDISPQGSLQLNLFHSGYYDEKQKKLMELIDQVNGRHGRHTLRLAAEGLQQDWRMKQAHLSRRYTTRWDELPLADADRVSTAPEADGARNTTGATL